MKSEKLISYPVNILDLVRPRKINYTEERISTGNKGRSDITINYTSFGVYVTYPTQSRL